MRKLLFILTALLCVMLFVSCASADEITAAFPQDEYTLLVGKNMLIKPVVKGTARQYKTSFSSSDTSVASVAGGKVTGQSVGTAVISCSVQIGTETYECSCTIHVDQPVTSVTVSQKVFTLPSKAVMKKPVVSVHPENASNKKLIVKTSNRLVATVTKDGIIKTGPVGGTAVITCSAADGSGASVSFNVIVPTIAWFPFEKDIVIDSPEGVSFYYFLTFDGSYAGTDYAQGDMISVEHITGTPLEQESLLNDYLKSQPFSVNAALKNYTGIRLVPQKVGKDRFAVRLGDLTKTINVTVTRNAVYEDLPYGSYEEKARKGLRYSLSGTVLSVEEGTERVLYVAADGDSRHPAGIILPPDDDSIYVEGSSVTVRGVFDKMTVYNPKTGDVRSIPQLTAEAVETATVSD